MLGRFTCETTITIIAGEVSPVSQPMHNAGRLTAARGRSQCWCSMLVLNAGAGVFHCCRRSQVLGRFNVETGGVIAQ